MEIRDPVHGNLVISRGEEKIINSRPFQRLRQIKQLGFSEFSFPGATHNRFLHSLGVCHLAGVAFDHIFAEFHFSQSDVRERLRQTFRLAALLHDVGHGPLSHTTEEVMPEVSTLRLKLLSLVENEAERGRQATHEDYTLMMITQSSLTEEIQKAFPDVEPYAVACLIDRRLPAPGDFFRDQGYDLRPILSQLVSSELDCDRMDYLLRDSHFCGTSYGKVELSWLINNMSYHLVGDELYLALNRRALYTFDDFLISRHHMHLMVYFHHKAIIYEEMLARYLGAEDCGYRLPSDIESYLRCTDASLFEHLAQVSNPWARRITERRPFKMLIELHSTEPGPRAGAMVKHLEAEGFEVIHASSEARLSKYHMPSAQDLAFQIYVVDQYDRWDEPFPIEQCTEIFKKYEENRTIDRLYVDPENHARAHAILSSRRF